LTVAPGIGESEMRISPPSPILRTRLRSGALAGADAVLDAAFRRVGVLRVETIAQLFDMAEALKIDVYPREMIPGELDRSIRLDLRGEGVIRVEGATVSNAPDPADLVISVSRKDLEALAQGKLNPMTAAITGRLKVSDMGLAMSLMPQVKALLEARTGEA
jgi:putative sterol carrier protein